MSVMSDPGLDLLALETLAENIAGLAYTARNGPSPQDRERAMTHLLEQGMKLARYLTPEPKSYAPDTFHKDADLPTAPDAVLGDSDDPPEAE